MYIQRERERGWRSTVLSAVRVVDPISREHASHMTRREEGGGFHQYQWEQQPKSARDSREGVDMDDLFVDPITK